MRSLLPPQFSQPDLSPSHPVPTTGKSSRPGPWMPVLLGRSRDTLAPGHGGSRVGFGQGDIR